MGAGVLLVTAGKETRTQNTKSDNIKQPDFKSAIYIYIKKIVAKTLSTHAGLTAAVAEALLQASDGG